MLRSITKWFDRGGGGGEPAKPRLSLAAFGKHPGWDDHIEDLGVDTPRLTWVKRVLYTEGVGGNIDSGAWDQLGEAKTLAGYKHVFVWRWGSGDGRFEYVIGRMWSSRDGKGRSKYPMVLAVHAEGVTLPWLIRKVLPRLEEIESRCVAEKTAVAVRTIIDSARVSLSAMLGEAGGTEGGGDLLAALPTRSELIPADGAAAMEGVPAGLLRILYELDKEMGAFRAPSDKRSTSRSVDVRARHLRVPRCTDAGPGEPSRLWGALLLTQLSEFAPALFLEPLDSGFVDILVGEPGAAQLLCVRANAAGVPLTSDIPYTIDPEFARQAAEVVSGWRNGSA